MTGLSQALWHINMSDIAVNTWSYAQSKWPECLKKPWRSQHISRAKLQFSWTCTLFLYWECNKDAWHIVLFTINLQILILCKLSCICRASYPYSRASHVHFASLEFSYLLQLRHELKTKMVAYIGGWRTKIFSWSLMRIDTLLYCRLFLAAYKIYSTC